MTQKRYFVILGIFLLSFCLFSGYAQQPESGDLYLTETRLFHIERSKNRNIVCYDLNPSLSGKPDEKEPVNVYWVNRETNPGQQSELSSIQKKLAFGYTVVNKSDGAITIEINALKKRRVSIVQDEKANYFCRMEINSQSAVLRKIYVKTLESNSMQVKYVDVSGNSLATGLPVTERIYRN